MLYSASPGVIFIKTRKTASSSTESVLQQALLDSVPEDDQEWFIAENGFCTPKIRLERPMSLAMQAQMRRKQGWPLARLRRIARLRSHSTPADSRAALGDEVWNRSLKVVNVRNPFDLLVSEFFFRKLDPRPEFNDWLETFTGLQPESPLSELMNGVADAVDEDWFVIRHESLDADLGRLLSRLDVARPIEVPTFKSSSRPTAARNYKDMYSASNRKLVEEAWPIWFERFEYGI